MINWQMTLMHCINLLTIYDKKEIPNVSDQYIDEIIRSL